VCCPTRAKSVSIIVGVGFRLATLTSATVLLYIHRSFFAQAIIEYPVNPLRSPYAGSFLAAYRASATILRTIRDHFAIQPALCSRFWSMWTFAFSAAVSVSRSDIDLTNFLQVVFGTIVTRGPRSPLASNAMSELDQACLLFSKAAKHSHRAAKALVSNRSCQSGRIWHL
jgi:hypothetical protein